MKILQAIKRFTQMIFPFLRDQPKIIEEKEIDLGTNEALLDLLNSGDISLGSGQRITNELLRRMNMEIKFIKNPQWPKTPGNGK